MNRGVTELCGLYCQLWIVGAMFSLVVKLFISSSKPNVCVQIYIFLQLPVMHLVFQWTCSTRWCCFSRKPNAITVFFVRILNCGCDTSSQPSVNTLDTQSHVEKGQKCAVEECHLLALSHTARCFPLQQSWGRKAAPGFLWREITWIHSALRDKTLSLCRKNFTIACVYLRV